MTRYHKKRVKHYLGSGKAITRRELYMKIVLNSSHLNTHGKLKPIDDLTVMDFRLSMHDVHYAHKILFRHRNRIIILKDRWPTEYSITKQSKR
jgi:hypothetical protein